MPLRNEIAHKCWLSPVLWPNDKSVRFYMVALVVRPVGDIKLIIHGVACYTMQGVSRHRLRYREKSTLAHQALVGVFGRVADVRKGIDSITQAVKPRVFNMNARHRISLVFRPQVGISVFQMKNHVHSIYINFYPNFRIEIN